MSKRLLAVFVYFNQPLQNLSFVLKAEMFGNPDSKVQQKEPNMKWRVK